jgi:ADP-ribosylglycohydrolase
MWLAVGIVNNEIPEWFSEIVVTCDLLVDGGFADVIGNAFELKTWEEILERYGEKSFTHIFIDGGLYGKVDNKEEIMDIMCKITREGIIKYGKHMLLRAKVSEVSLIEDPFKRGYPFTYIPISKYRIENVKWANECLIEMSKNGSEILRTMIEMKQML